MKERNLLNIQNRVEEEEKEESPIRKEEKNPIVIIEKVDSRPMSPKLADTVR